MTLRVRLSVKVALLSAVYAALLVPIAPAPAGAQALRAFARAAHKASAYELIGLPTLGGSQGAANAVNETGWAVGSTYVARNAALHAAWWAGKRTRDLGTLGGTNSNATAINSAGTIAGYAETSYPDPEGELFCSASGLTCSATAWEGRRVVALPSLGGNNSAIFGMNAQEIAVGVAETAAYDGSCYGKQVRQISAALWHVRSGRVSELPPLPGDPDAVAHAINVWGNVAGGSGTCAQAEGFALPNHAVLWRHGKPQDLGNLGGSAAFAAAINDQNQVVGWANLPGDAAYHAFLWHGGRMTDLGTLPGDISSIATGINDEGQIVGASFDASGGKRAFVCRHGKMVDLNSLVPPSGTLSVLQANAINSYGEIVGYAGDTQVRGHISGFLAIPTGSIRSF